IASWTASLSTTSRPIRRSITAAGALPRRKPGMLTCCAISRYAFLREGSNSANGTSSASLTRVGPSVSTVLFTLLLATVWAASPRWQDGAPATGAFRSGPVDHDPVIPDRYLAGQYIADQS